MKRSELITELSSWLLAILFTYTAISKLIDWSGTQSAMYNQVFPIWMADILLILLPVLELLVAVMVLIPSVRRYGLMLSILLMAAFTLYIGIVVTGIFGRVPCSCGGVISLLDWKSHLVFNLVILGLAVIGYRYRSKELSKNQES